MKKERNNSFSISNIKKSDLSKEESDKRSLKLGLKGMENAAKNLNDGSKGKNKK